MALAARDPAGEGLATNHYFDRNFNLPAVKLLPGEYYVTNSDIVLVTVLGSCVSACIRDPLTGVGGMNHFMLPDAGADLDNPLSSSARYGTFAMEILINELTKLGAARNRFEAKVFGGGNVLKGMDHANVGERNSVFVLGFLAFENISLSAKDLMDDFPRKIYYFPRTGKVLVKKLRTVANDTLFTRERDYGRRLRMTKVTGDVELFS